MHLIIGSPVRSSGEGPVRCCRQEISGGDNSCEKQKNAGKPGALLVSRALVGIPCFDSSPDRNEGIIHKGSLTGREPRAPITSSTVISIGGRFIHPRCFNASYCKKMRAKFASRINLLV